MCKSYSTTTKATTKQLDKWICRSAYSCAI